MLYIKINDKWMGLGNLSNKLISPRNQQGFRILKAGEFKKRSGMNETQA